MKFKLPEEFSEEDLELTKSEMEETRQKSLKGEEQKQRTETRNKTRNRNKEQKQGTETKSG